jgi:hypothetical protein
VSILAREVLEPEVDVAIEGRAVLHHRAERRAEDIGDQIARRHLVVVAVLHLDEGEVERRQPGRDHARRQRIPTAPAEEACGAAGERVVDVEVAELVGAACVRVRAEVVIAADLERGQPLDVVVPGEVRPRGEAGVEAGQHTRRERAAVLLRLDVLLLGGGAPPALPGRVLRRRAARASLAA